MTPLFFHTARSVLASTPESPVVERRRMAVTALLVVIVVAAVTAALLRSIG